MRTALILFRDNISDNDGEYLNKIFSVFKGNGFPIDRVEMFSLTDDLAFKRTLENIKYTTDNLIVIYNPSVTFSIKQIISEFVDSPLVENENAKKFLDAVALVEGKTYPEEYAFIPMDALRVILNGLGKDAAMIISRINGFTYVQTEFDPYTEEVNVISETAYSTGDRAKVKCYGSDSVPEGVAIMRLENVGVSITGNSTNPTRFQHPVAGTYKKWCNENGKSYFSVASGGGTGRTLHPDNMAAGPASYGMTDTMGRMHGDAQFAGSSSVPAHVEMMGLIGAGNNPMVGMTVAVAVAIEEASK